jgi:hypothetical protein
MLQLPVTLTRVSPAGTLGVCERVYDMIIRTDTHPRTPRQGGTSRIKGDYAYRMQVASKGSMQTMPETEPCY